ncbi:MAG: hypothetical protein ABSA93_40415 [Streptosporangiaceae bacterium]
MSRSPALRAAVASPSALSDPPDPLVGLLDPAWRPGAWDGVHRILLVPRADPWITAYCCLASDCDYVGPRGPLRAGTVVRSGPRSQFLPAPRCQW